MTLRDLLTHRARIRSFTTSKEYEKPRREISSKGSLSNQRRKFIEYVIQLEPENLNDSVKYVYSNASYATAASMLEKVAGKTWEELMMDIFHRDIGLNLAFKWPNQLMDASLGVMKRRAIA